MNDLYVILGGIAGFIALLVGVFFRGKSAQKDQQKIDIADKIGQANESDKKLSSLSVDDIRNRANKWLRKR